ncbi:MAG: tRNA lysidine(34) synthetase TilS [Clostridia bacterium]|nr:tRNA lysidine(34) synthetase TilS [Clostridia bacterium]
MNIILDEINKHTHLAVAVSGGIDSMCLLHYLWSNGYCVSAFYVNHHIREDACLDCELIDEFCRSRSIPFTAFDVYAVEYSVEHKLSVETGARILRREIYDKLSRQFEFVLLAHHADDRAESILMHIIRGSGLSGIVGTNYRNGFLLRPLIKTPKEEIRDYQKANNVPYRDDSTNEDQSYSRNYVRHTIIPQLKKLNPDLSDAIIRLGDLALCDSDYFEQCVEECVNTDNYRAVNENEVCIGAEYLDSLHYSISSRLILRAFFDIGVKVDIERIHITSVLELCKAQSGKKINLPHNSVVCKEFGELRFFRKSTNNKGIEENIAVYAQNRGDFCDQLVGALAKLGINADCTKYSDEVDSCKKDAPRILTADLDKLLSSCKTKCGYNADVRHVRDGDKLTVGCGTKKLSDLFAQRKIPVSKRRSYLALESADFGILAVFGLELCADIFMSKETNTIIRLELK